jgi:hypothetical protein
MQKAFQHFTHKILHFSLISLTPSVFEVIFGLSKGKALHKPKKFLFLIKKDSNYHLRRVKSYFEACNFFVDVLLYHQLEITEIHFLTNKKLQLFNSRCVFLQT